MKSRLILCAMMLAAAGVSRAAYTPVPIQSSSYNADVIVESNATPRLDLATSASVDNGTNNTANTWFEIGFDTNNPGNGLPAAGSTFTALDDATHSFTMAPSYAAPNGIAIDTEVTNGTFTLTTPAAYTKLSFLGSGGNGGDAINVVVHHQDGTSETGSFGCPDWFNGTGVAYIAGGRCNSTINLTPEVDGTGGSPVRGNPRIYYRDITLTDTTSPVTSIDLTYASGQSSSHNDIMGVSGALTSGNGTTVTPITVTGYDYDFVVEVGAAHSGRVVSQTMVDGTNVWATSQSLDTELDTGNSWYEKGYDHNNAASGTYNSPLQDFTGTGLPHPGGYITNASGDHIYQMPSDYTANNAVYIGTPASITNATITLTTPTAFSGLSFLGSAGNGPVTVNLVINHQNGISQSNTLTVKDWFNNGPAVAYVANGRVAVDTAFYGNINSGDPVLQQNDIVLADQVSPVTSIYIENTNAAGGRFAIFALSGATGALPPVITQDPASVNQYAGASVSFTSMASANASLTYQWQKGTNGVYVNVSNGGNISGATTTTLNINPIGFTDQGDYRLVATDSAGSVNSTAATLEVFSPSVDVTMPGDSISYFGGSAFGDSPVSQAIDDNVGAKFGMDLSSGAPTPSGLIVSPASGLTLVTGLRVYTANDTTDRDPTDYELEGSDDGGHTFTLIASNSLALPDGRNTAAGAPNPLTQFVQEVDFANATSYTTYRLTFHNYKGGAGYTQLQIGEIELLGTTVPGFYFNPQPFDAKAFDQGSANFYANATDPSAVPTVKWLKGNNGVYTPLTDGGNISGSQTTYLSITPATFADVADYIAVAYNGSQYITSSVAHLYIYSTNVDVTQPSDPVTEFGNTDSSGRFPNNGPAYAFDNTFTEYENGGDGLNAAAGFAPFGGPVGVVITPAVGSTVLSGIRFYPGQDAPGSDPSGYVLEGSNDGTTYTTISSGSLSLGARNTIDLAVDPTQSSATEILFSNTKGYTSYRLTFPTIANPGNSGASYLELGDIELLGVAGGGVAQPMISGTTFSGGNLNITGNGGAPNGSYSVLTNGDLTVPVASWGTAMTGTFDGSGNFTISLPVSMSNSHLFYVIKTP
jgi:hypothetical protein